MVKKPTLDIENTVVREHIESLQGESYQNVLELSAAPTATAPLLEDNQWGVYSNVLYQRVSNTILVFTPGSTITVT
jgi:hypothetical protein